MPKKHADNDVEDGLTWCGRWIKEGMNTIGSAQFRKEWLLVSVDQAKRQMCVKCADWCLLPEELKKAGR